MNKLIMMAAALSVLGTRLAAFADDAYIASTTDTTKTYWIDTGYHAGPNTRVDADFEFLTRTADQGKTYQQFVFEYGYESTCRIYINGSAGTGAIAWNCSAEGLWASTGVTMVPGVRYQMRIDPYENIVTLDADGDRKYTYQPSVLPGTRSAVCSHSLKLFNAANSTGNGALMKLYRFSIYESGELVRDYVPCLKGGTPGLYDLVNGGFIKDDRLPEMRLNYGGDIMELPDDGYVASDGTVGVNSRYFFNPKSRIEVDYALTDAATGQQRVYGRDTAGPMSSLYVQGNLNIAFGFGDSFVNSDTQTGIKADTLRHTAIIDVKNKTAAYITGTTTNWSKNAILDTHVPTSTSTVPVGIFAGISNNTGGMSYGNFAKVKIYRITFYTDGNKVHDYVPCVQGGIVGFKDLVDSAFITSETAGDLTYGGNILVENGPGYIDNNGKATFDTGHTPTPHTRVEVDYLHVNNLKDNRVFSAYAADKLYYMHYANGSVQYAWSCMDTNGNWTSTGLAVNKFRRRTFILDPHTDFTGLVTAGYTNYSSTVSGPVAAKGGTYVKPDAGSSLKVCCDTGGSLVSNMRLYGLRIYEAGTLVRDYIPYVQNGEAGLYDQVNNTFKGSNSRYAFTAGGDITTNGRDDAYLESDSTQGINTEYLMKGSESRVEVDFAFMDVYYSSGTTYQQRAFGQDSGGGLLYSLYINGSGQFRFGFGNSTFNISDSFGTADTKRHTAIIDGKNSVAKLVTNGTTNSYDYSGFAHDNTSTWPMGVFATPNNQAATTWRNPSKIKLYSLRIYEQDVLKHEYIPYKKGTTVGLYDMVDKVVKTDARSGNAFGYGGKGVDGAEKWIVVPQGGTLTKAAGTKVLSANASGAVSYKWTKNGEVIEGGTDGDLIVEWARGGATDTYTVTPVYSVYDVETEGVPLAVTVENLPQGTAIILR